MLKLCSALPRKSSRATHVKQAMRWLLFVLFAAALVWVGYQLWQTFFLGRF
jgi:hypothetical protein